MNAMKERPILFKGEMVRAILEGRKTMTRRVCKPQPSQSAHTKGHGGIPMRVWWETGKEINRCPYGRPGDRLWVREAHLLDPPIDGTWPDIGDTFASINDIPMRYRTPEHVIYRATADDADRWRWRPSIHMPRWASRILLEVTEVRVERLAEISQADAIAEGMPEQTGPFLHHVIADFRRLWQSINGPDSWALNPWVWVVSFKRTQP